MGTTQRFNLSWLGLGAWLAAGLGCSNAGSSDMPQVSSVEAAVTIFDCQSQSLQCLGVFPTRDKIDSCRMDLTSCIGQAQKDMQAEGAALDKCRQDAMTCGQAAKSASDAIKCRSDFQSCVGAAAMAAGGGAGGTSAAGGAGGASGGSAAGAGGTGAAGTGAAGTGAAGTGAGGTSAGFMQCRDDAMKCVQAAKSPMDIGACNETYRSCVAKLAPPPPSGAGGAGGAGGGQFAKLDQCRRDGLTCISKATSPSDARACDDAYRMCVGLPPLPMLPSGPPTGGAAGRGFPRLPGFPGGGASGASAGAGGH